jgi:iron complex transport system substrate-binding protein
VATLRPDLITFTKSDNVKAGWDQLEKLAPTLSGPAGTRWKFSSRHLATRRRSLK